MRLPKKISPDRIRESIVQIFYTTSIPFEPMVGYLHGILSEMGFQYTNRPLRHQNALSGTSQHEINLGEFMIVPQHFFFNEKIKIQLHQNRSLIFNCINEYIGWSEYFSFIKNVISKLMEHKLIVSTNRLGMRYISEFPNIDVLEKIKFRFEMSGMKNSISNGNFRLEWNDEPHKVILNIGSKLPISSIIEMSGTKIQYVSLIDLDVIAQEFESSDCNKLFEAIDTTHTKQKVLFFGLLQEEFLATLNPEYE